MPVRAPSSGKAGVTIFGTTLNRRQTTIMGAVVLAVLAALIFVIPKALGNDEPSRDGRTAGTPAASAPQQGGGVAAPTGAAATPSIVASTAPTQASAAPSTPASAAPPSSAPANNTAVTLPAGWYMYRDSSGFSVPAPKGWGVQRQGTEVYFRDNTRAGRILIVDQTRSPQWDPVADWKSKEADRRGSYSNYRRLRIALVPYWKKAADWEFTRTSERGNPLHVLKRGFITADDQAYGITWSTSEGNWNGDQANLQLIFKGFKPARAD